MVPEGTDQNRFVNPYSFISLRDRVDRQEPRPHNAVRTHEGHDLFSGSVDVSWRLETPLLLPESAEHDGWLDGHTVRIPGSSIKGVVRSTHEALFNGCLRVLDAGFLPAHRNPPNRDNDAQQRGKGLILGVVAASRQGTPTEIVVCDDVVWLEAVTLARALQSPPTSGDVIDCPQVRRAEAGAVGRKELSAVTDARFAQRPTVQTVKQVSTCQVTPGQRFVLVTDTAARPQRHRGSENVASCYWASAAATDRALPVTDEAVNRYRMAVYGARDLQVGRRPDGTPDGTEKVEWWDGPGGTRIPRKRSDTRKIVVGYRKRASLDLNPGDVVWIREGVDQHGDPCVHEIMPSRIWRDLGTGTVAERLPLAAGDGHPATLACRHPYPRPDGETWPDGFPVGLCPTCRLFGMADTAGSSRGRGQQESFSGRVRFDSAVADQVTLSPEFALAPRGNPHPSAGGFYLSLVDPVPDSADGDVAAHWGSAADGPTNRRIRGRKYYWHNDPDAQAAHWSEELARAVRPRYQARPHHAETQTRTARCVSAGTVFTARLTVDGVSAEEMTELLAALDPGRLLSLVDKRPGTRRYGVHLGGGKAFGLGSVGVTALTCTVTPVTSRYAAAPTGAATARDESAFHVTAAALRACAQRGAIGPLGQLARLLDPDGLGRWGAHTAYPPDAT